LRRARALTRIKFPAAVLWQDLRQRGALRGAQYAVAFRFRI